MSVDDQIPEAYWLGKLTVHCETGCFSLMVLGLTVTGGPLYTYRGRVPPPELWVPWFWGRAPTSVFAKSCDARIQNHHLDLPENWNAPRLWDFTNIRISPTTPPEC